MSTSQQRPKDDSALVVIAIFVACLLVYFIWRLAQQIGVTPGTLFGALWKGVVGIGIVIALRIFNVMPWRIAVPAIAFVVWCAVCIVLSERAENLSLFHDALPWYGDRLVQGVIALGVPGLLAYLLRNWKR